MSGLIRLLCLLAGYLCCALAQTLAPGTPVHAEIRGRQSRSYSVQLNANDYLHLKLAQHGIALTFRLFGPDGARAIEIPYDKDETGQVFWVADKSGVYRLELVPDDPQAPSGQFELTIADLRPATAEDRTRAMRMKAFVKADELGESARKHRARHELEQAIADVQQEIAIRHGLGRGLREAQALNTLGSLDEDLSKYEDALAAYGKALEICRRLKSTFGEATVLDNIAGVYDALAQYDAAIQQYQQALALRRGDLHDGPGEATTLNNIGMSYANLGYYDKAIEFLEQSLAVRAERKPDSVAATLNNLGVCYLQQSRYNEAIEKHERALAIRRQIKDGRGEGESLTQIGTVYKRWSQYRKAIEYYAQALPLLQEARDRRAEAATLDNLGSTYYELSEFEKAVGYSARALAIHRETQNRKAESLSLNTMAAEHEALGEFREAVDCLQQALAISRTIHDRAGEAIALGNLGTAYEWLNDHGKAIPAFQSALALYRDIKDLQGEASVLNNLGRTAIAQLRYGEAAGFLEQALAIERRIHDRKTEGVTLNNLGVAWLAMDQPLKSAEFCRQAVAIAREVSDRSGEASALYQLALIAKRQAEPRLAVFYAKQSVNVIQSIRGDIRGLSKESQQSYLKNKEGNYRMLADLLIAQGRLPEAQQVVNLLKEEEYFAFVRRDGAKASGLDGRAGMTAEESDWARRYDDVAGQLVAAGTRYNELLQKKDRSPADEDELKRLDQDLRAGNQAFQRVLQNMTQQLSAKAGASTSSMLHLKDIEAFGDDLAELGNGAVAIYTLAGDDKLRTILVTPSVRRAYEYPITAAKLNEKVARFRELLQNPQSDPRPLANELYRMLIVPALEEDLRQAKAETLMFSLDGGLRYAPMAALFDGEHYLIEKYRLAVFTPASNTRLKEAPHPDWKLAGFGVTRQNGEFPALPNVAEELGKIVKTENGSPGILPGESLLDDAFTESSMLSALRRGYTVVHIATHFNFEPGDETKSFLLLGDGKHLSLAELDSMSNPFRGVDLLTLSGCNTGIGDGREIEGMGVIAQRKGAKAVIASLWPVADESTSVLMQEFYRIRQSNSGMLKIEALRQAQLELLSGKVRPAGGSGADRGVRRLGSTASPQQRSYAHPYYWAPFFLIGNWK